LICLIDSNVLVWWLAEPARLTKAVHELISDPETQIIVSEATVWEISNKIHAGRLRSVGESIHALLEELAAQDMALLLITLSQIKRTTTLPLHHQDPFDRLLIAQAMERQIPLIASDAKIKLYDLEVIW